jgi:hypothetical protein
MNTYYTSIVLPVKSRLLLVSALAVFCSCSDSSDDPNGPIFDITEVRKNQPADIYEKTPLYEVLPDHPVFGCQDDLLEVNDSYQEAQPLSFDSLYSLSMCSGDVDYFLVKIEQKSAIEIRMTSSLPGTLF